MTTPESQMNSADHAATTHGEESKNTEDHEKRSEQRSVVHDDENQASAVDEPEGTKFSPFMNTCVYCLHDDC